MKGQFGMGYLMVYAFSLVMLGGIVLSKMAVSSIAAHSFLYNTSSCNITPNIICNYVYLNESSRMVTVALTDNTGVSLTLPKDSIRLTVIGIPQTYLGNCKPLTVQNGGTVICTAHVNPTALQQAQQLTVDFSFEYQICLNGECGTDLNTTGSALLNAQ